MFRVCWRFRRDAGGPFREGRVRALYTGNVKRSGSSKETNKPWIDGNFMGTDHCSAGKKIKARRLRACARDGSLLIGARVSKRIAINRRLGQNSSRTWGRKGRTASRTTRNGDDESNAKSRLALRLVSDSRDLLSRIRNRCDSAVTTPQTRLSSFGLF